ncbi:MAG: ABC transporter substrate-binding protein [Thermoleophilaceae bacterium]
MLRAALVTPLSGPLARYGRAGALALRLWAEWYPRPVELRTYDAHPDPITAIRDAERDRPDLLFGPYGSGPARAVAAATTRLLWNHGGAEVEPAANVVSLLAPATTYFEGAIQAVKTADPETRRIAILHSEIRFARAVAAGAVRMAARLGLEATLGPLTATPAIDAPEADLLLTAGGFEDELAAARRLLPGRWRAAGFVGAGVEEVLSDLGPLREGLLGPAQWLAEAATTPDEGPSAKEFAAAYRSEAGTDPPYPAAQAFAAGVIAGRCLRDVEGTDDNALLAAARALDCTTMFGRFRLDPETAEQIGHRVLTVQWQDGRREVVWPRERATAALRHPLGR